MFWVFLGGKTGSSCGKTESGDGMGGPLRRSHLDPKLLVEGAGDDATFKEDDGAFVRAGCHFVIQIIPPIP